MEIALTIDPWWVAAALAYLLIGALGTLIYQSNCQPANRFGFAGCFFWVLFWLPAGVVVLFFMVIGQGGVWI